MALTITREQVLEASKGMLQMQFYMVHSYPTAGMEPVMKNLPDHLEHQCALERDGIMLAAGPHWNDDESTWDGEGHVRDPGAIAGPRPGVRLGGPHASLGRPRVQGAALADQ